MTFISIIVLFSVLFLAALIPSLSSITVFTRSISSGFGHGVLVSLGVVAGDICFILIAVFGLSMLVSAVGHFVFILKLISACYIILLASILWRTKNNPVSTRKLKDCSLISSFMTGLLITLSDHKAMLFYLGLFPSLLDLSTISMFDTSLILAVTVVAVGGAKVCYAYMAARTWTIFKNTRLFEKINIFAALLLLTIGVVIIFSAGNDVFHLINE